MELKQLPKQLKDITLERWVGWHSMYGTDLIKRGKRKGMTEDEQLLFRTDFFCKHYAWYSGIPLAEVEEASYGENSMIVEIVKEASLSQNMLFNEMCGLQNFNLKEHVFDFNGLQLKVLPPVNVSDTTKLTVADFTKAQMIALTLSDLQDGKYESLYELCAQYLQPVGKSIKVFSAFKWTEEDKIEWAKTLPLHIALCVKNYVVETINLYKSLNSDRTTATA